MRATAPKPPLLGIYWLGIQCVWGALLGISLQARTLELAAGDGVAAYGRIAAIGAAIAAITQVIVGPLSDRLRRGGGRREGWYVAGAAIGAAAVVWFYLAPTLVSAAFAFFVLQFGLNLAIGPYQALIPDVFEARGYASASSWMAALQSAGNALGAVAASLIADARVLGTSIAFVLLGSMVPTVLHSARLQLQPVREEALRVTRAFVDLFVSRALVYVGFYTLLGYMLFYVHSTLGVDDVTRAKFLAGVMILLFTVAGIAGAAIASAAKRMEQRLLATIGGGIFVIALASFIAFPAFGVTLASVTIAGTAWGIFLVADWALGCAYVPRTALATAMGLWNLAVVGPQVLAPVIATAVLSYTRTLHSGAGPKVAFAAAAIEVILGIAWVWRLCACVLGE